MDSFCQVEGAAAGGLKNLLTATEAVRDDECLQRRLAHSRQQHAFTGSLRDRVFITFEAERASHTATSRVKRLQFGAHFANERFGVGHFHERFLMAVAVQQDFSRKSRGFMAGSIAFEKLAEKKVLAAQA